MGTLFRASALRTTTGGLHAPPLRAGLVNPGPVGRQQKWHKGDGKINLIITYRDEREGAEAGECHPHPWAAEAPTVSVRRR